MALTERTERLIDAAAKLGTSLAERLNVSGLGFLVWTSPIGSRSPEEALVWHPGYGVNPSLRIMGYIIRIMMSSFKGVIRFLGYKGFNYVHINKKSRILLVIPDEITDHSSNYRTSYLSEDQDFPTDKIVFSRSKKIGQTFTSLTYLKKIKFSVAISRAITKDIFEKIQKKEANIYYLDVLVTFLEWFLSGTWYFHFDLYSLVKKLVSSEQSNYKALVAVHEMHFYSKIVWQIAKEKALLGITGQHAMIIPEKLWYFPHKNEIEAKFAMPDIFFVYSEATKNILKNSYPVTTKFPLCHSPRFKGWKDIGSAYESPQGKGKNKEFILFAGGLTPFDTTSLLEGIDNLLNIKHSGKNMKIRYRLHPHARIRLRDRIRISNAVNSKNLELSNSSLIEDLEKSYLVIGAYTMVLRQAALLGIPVLSMQSRNYIHPSVLPQGEKWNEATDELSWDRIARQINTIPDSSTKKYLINDLGMDNAEFSTKLIYETCNMRRGEA